jgi:hypothetical protein
MPELMWLYLTALLCYRTSASVVSWYASISILPQAATHQPARLKRPP